MNTGDGLHTGRVVDYDEQVGLGTVEDAAGATVYPFHCTQVADGSRVIPVGAAVTFELVAGHHGRFEAAAIRLR